MAITTYSELQTAVSNWLDRNDLTNRITEFISLAEADIFDDLRLRQMQTKYDLTIDGEYVSLPTGFLEALRLYIDGDPVQPVEYLTNEAIIPYIISTTGKPDFFTVVGDELQFNRTADSSYTGKLVYYASPGALSDSNTSNTVLTNYPNIYLYGALVHAEPFLGNDARLQTWKLMYKGAVDKANLKAKDGSRSSAPQIKAR